MLLLITYDLKQPDRNYNALYDAIKNCGKRWWHYLESVWIVYVENSTPQECYNHIHPYMDNNDNLFIVDITDKDFYGWLPKDAWRWLNDNN